jgi:hypothetical protein
LGPAEFTSEAECSRATEASRQPAGPEAAARPDVPQSRSSQRNHHGS